MADVKIDKEFKSLIPPLSKVEREQLEANIVAEGCRDPLVLNCSNKYRNLNHERTRKHRSGQAVSSHHRRTRVAADRDGRLQTEEEI